MGKKAKGIRAEKRKALKRAAKARKKALYQGYAASGQNKKSKRHVLRTRRTRVSPHKHTHENSFCGNLGCKKCFPKPKLFLRNVKTRKGKIPKRNRSQRKFCQGAVHHAPSVGY